ncbi:hypothetical protein AOA12_02885 [Microbacterium sp. No. 7]|nr:hypothetical protein AOA12_02885 [Microbacterium sp. No. 7]
MLARAGRVLAMHWPALLAWYLAGLLARYLVIELAAFVGAFTALGGLLILPLAVLARLVSFVAMLLVVRDGLATLNALAPRPAAPRDRRRAFVDALLGGILPFFAFYAAWKMLSDDVIDYIARALRVQSGLRMQSIVTGQEVLTEGTIDDLGTGPLVLALIVVAFVARLLLKRHRDRLPRAVDILAVYLETVWVFFSVLVLSELIGGFSGWVQQRQGMVWLADARAWLGERIAPLAWAWDAVLWLVGQAGGLVLLPLAWLTIAGVIYGQAVAAQAPQLSGRLVETARERYRVAPGWLRRRLNDVVGDVVSRFRPIGRAVVLMWRAGPLLISSYVLLFTVLLLVQQLVLIGVTRLLGPHDADAFWVVLWPALTMIPPLLIEPVRISLVAAAYDVTLRRLAPAEAASAVEGEAQEGSLLGDPEVDEDGARAGGDDEGRRDRVGGVDV